MALAFCFVEVVMPAGTKWYAKRSCYATREPAQTTARWYKRHVLNSGKYPARKPFNCIKCMTGWFALVLAVLCGYGFISVLLCAAGLFMGALFEAIKMRWL